MTDAFNAMLLDERSHLNQYARYLAKGKDDADDLVQETMRRALEKQEQFSEGTNLRAWLIVIMRNWFFSQRRKCGRLVSDIDGVFASQLQANEDTGRIVEARDAIRHLDDLPADTRNLLLMSVEGIPLEVMAKSQGVALGTVKSRINRGREMFHRVLGDQVPA